MKSLTLILFVCGVVVFLTGFTRVSTINKCIEGSGKAKSEKRETKPFSAIDVGGAFDVVVVCGKKQAIKVTADDNLLPHVLTQVKGDTLHIFSKESICAKKELKVEISVDTLNRIAASGAVDMDISQIDTPRFALDVGGSGTVKVAGRTKTFDVDISGAADLNARKLKSQVTRIEVSGSGDATVHASRELHARLSGAGDITYYGKPEKVDTDISGAGDIESGE